MRKTSLEWKKLASFGAAFIMWFGLWGAWIPGKAASLTLNVFDVVDWSAYLLDVRSGGIPAVPDLLRLAVVLIVIAALISLNKLDRLPLRWGIRCVIAIPVLLLITPPYPMVLDLWWSETYGLRFTVASVLAASCILLFLVDQTNTLVQRSAILVLVAAGSGLGWWAFSQLRGPFSAHYGAMVSPGWGMFIFNAGSIMVFGLALLGLFQKKKVG